MFLFIFVLVLRLGMKWRCFSKWLPLASSFTYLKPDFHWLNTREESCNIPSKCCCRAASLPLISESWPCTPPSFKLILFGKPVASESPHFLMSTHLHIIQNAPGLNLPLKNENSLCKEKNKDKPSLEQLLKFVMNFKVSFFFNFFRRELWILCVYILEA